MILTSSQESLKPLAKSFATSRLRHPPNMPLMMIRPAQFWTLARAFERH
jgi:hypothetical protein